MRPARQSHKLISPITREGPGPEQSPENRQHTIASTVHGIKYWGCIRKFKEQVPFKLLVFFTIKLFKMDEKAVSDLGSKHLKEENGYSVLACLRIKIGYSCVGQ